MLLYKINNIVRIEFIWVLKVLIFEQNIMSNKNALQ